MRLLLPTRTEDENYGEPRQGRWMVDLITGRPSRGSRLPRPRSYVKSSTCNGGEFQKVYIAVFMGPASRAGLFSVSLCRGERRKCEIGGMEQ